MLPAFFDENLHQQFAESFSSMSGRQVYCRFEGISVSRPLFPGMCIAVSHNFMVCFAYEKGKVGKNFCYTQAYLIFRYRLCFECIGTVEDVLIINIGDVLDILRLYRSNLTEKSLFG